MEVAKAAETNGAPTFSFLQHFRVVFGIFYLLRDAARSLAGGRAFGIQEEEEDQEAGAPEAKEETNVQTLKFKFLHDNFNKAVRNSIVENALGILPTFPATFWYTLPGLYGLEQIKGQIAPFGFPSPKVHKWYIVCVTSLLTEFVASVAQWIISAAVAGP